MILSRKQRCLLNRRKFLLGTGGIALALPWLEQYAARQAVAAPTAQGPKRIIVMAYEMGVPGGAWNPVGTGSGFELPYVTAPLEAYKDRCTFVSSIDNLVLKAGGNGYVFGHPGKKECALTGTLTTSAFATQNDNALTDVLANSDVDGAANGPSIEQVVGTFLRTGEPLASVNLGIDGKAGSSNRGPSPTASSHFFHESRGNALTMQMHPRAAFDQLFASLTSNDPSEAQGEIERLRARNKSVLDAVRKSFGDLKKGLGSEDRKRLEEHADLLRELEVELTVTESCGVPSGIPDQTDFAGAKMDVLAGLQNKIMAYAMGCGIAPIGRLEYLNQQNPRFGIADLDNTLDGADSYDWHAMVHGDPLPGTSTPLRPDGGNVPDYDPRLKDGYRFFVSRFADLLAQLDSIPEGEGTTVLDHTMLLLASDLGEGMGHGMGKMGYVLAGNLGPGKTGYHLDAGPKDRAYEVGGAYFYAESEYSVNQLLNSMLDMAGVQDENGAPVTLGLTGWLESRDAPRRIDDLFS